MNLKELARAVATQTGETIKSVERTLEAALEQIKAEVDHGNEVTLHGFGKLKLVSKPGRTGRNPSTGAPVEILPKNVVKFVPAKAFNDQINN